MTTSLRALGLGLLLAASTATVASAQYEPVPTGGGATTTTAAPATTVAPRPTTTVNAASSTTRPATTTTDAPPPPTHTATINTATAQIGDELVLSAPATAGVAVFDEDLPIASGMVSADGGRAFALVPVLEVLGNGTVTVSVTVPPGVRDGLYIVYVVGTGPDGKQRVIMADVVVHQTTAAALVDPSRQVARTGASGPPQPQVAAAAPVAVPAAVRAIEPLTPQEEAAIVEAVLDDGADVRIEGERLVLYRPAEDASMRPIVTAASVAIAGGALVSLRFRRLARVKRR